jgi:outer membrane protein TolC
MNTKTARAFAVSSGFSLAMLLWEACCYAQPPQEAMEIPAADAFLAPESEAEIKQLVLDATKHGGAGALSYLRNRKLLVFTNAEALHAAQENNLAIQASQQDKEIAQEFLRENKAVFNPILNLSGSYSRSETYNRSETITRARGSTLTFFDRQTGAPSNPSIVPNPPNENGIFNPSNSFANFVCVTVDGFVVNPSQCALETVRLKQLEFASAATRPVENWSFDFGATQLFPWGQSLNADFQSVYLRKNFFRLDSFGLDQPLSSNDPIGQGSTFPWTTAFVATFISPLPFSKNFGPYGSVANVGVMLSDRGNRQAAWNLEAQANDALLAVNEAYWDVVRNIRQLQITIEQRQVLEALAKRAQRLFEARTITTYDKAQTEANLENIKNQEQIAWNNFIASSNSLVELLNYEPGTIILPAGYSADLLASEDRSPIPIESQEAFDTAMERRPEIKASQIAIESSDILVKHRQTQIRPDLTLTAGVTFNQSNAVLGYSSWENSFGNVFNPDTSDFFVGVSFRIPFGNLAARSALSQARIGRNLAMDQSQQTINAVTQEINTVITDAYGSHARIKQTRANLDLAQLAYNKADLLKEQGLVTDFELLRKLSDLLSARSAYIDTLIDYRKTRARLLRAQGVLAAQY